jgi:hypothetical protein
MASDKYPDISARLDDPRPLRSSPQVEAVMPSYVQPMPQEESTSGSGEEEMSALPNVEMEPVSMLGVGAFLAWQFRPGLPRARLAWRHSGREPKTGTPF